MVGKRKDLKKFEDCNHKQGLFFVKYNTMTMVCRHCKKHFELPRPAIMERATGAAAAKKGSKGDAWLEHSRQATIPQPA
jgi:hypothetical protein